MEKTIEIPAGYEARIEGNKVILERKESEEQPMDEKIRQYLIQMANAIRADDFELSGLNKEEVLAYLERQKYEYEVFEPIESTLEYKVGFRAGIESEKQKEQQPAEWSEGIKEALDKISDYLKYKGREEDADFIRHLRQQPHWKPSEEQMEYLAKGIIILGEEGNCKTSAVLNELRNDLQKLM